MHIVKVLHDCREMRSRIRWPIRGALLEQDRFGMSGFSNGRSKHKAKANGDNGEERSRAIVSHACNSWVKLYANAASLDGLLKWVNILVCLSPLKYQEESLEERFLQLFRRKM
jgi:hypothetical protein